MPEQLDEKQIELYLLGALPAAETERLDELSLTDDAFAERLRAAEYDLVDAYARGDLSGEMTVAFKSHYLASPRRLDKVRFAEAFRSFAADAAAGVRDQPATSPGSTVLARSTLQRVRWMNWFGAPRPGWAFGAAALVVLAAVAYLALENLRLRSQMAQAQGERAVLERREEELERQIDDNRSDGAKTADDLARVRDRLAQLEQQTGQHVKPGPRGRDLKVVAFTLAPPTRGAGPIPRLVIPAGVGVVALDLELESSDFPEYRAALKNPATDQVAWRSDRLSARSRGKNKAISIRLRASLLKPQNYILEVTGMPAGGGAEIIASYPFRIVIQ